MFKPTNPSTRLITLAGLVLFLELALIRWCSAYVLYLGYFSNFILLACFLGIGLGFLAARRAEWDLFKFAPITLMGVLSFVYLAQTEMTLPDFSERVFFGFVPTANSLLPFWVSLPVIFVGVAAVFVCICQETGRVFSSFPTLKAYNLDIVGSILGIVLFSAMSFASVPAWGWFVTVALVMGWLYWPNRTPKLRRQAVVALLGCVVVVVLSKIDYRADDETWSPYQVVSVAQDEDRPEIQHLTVNRIPHQTMFPVALDLSVYHSTYDIADAHGAGPFKRALIIGAGTGTDVAYALSRGVESIDAVEIDPVIAEYGRQLHPDRPYEDPRVNLIVDDGRNVLARTPDDTYDLVIFALPDSLALLTSYSSLRLESFLFTVESVAAARRVLRDDGALVMYNYYRSQDVVDRLAMLMQHNFGKWPSIRQSEESGLSVLMIGAKIDAPRAATLDPAAISIPTDDWPFLYMARPAIPLLYIIPILLILLISVVAVRKISPPTSIRPVHITFFMMGAAFLLLETKSIVTFSLLFGATWLTNSLVFLGVLVMVLGANLLVMYRPPRLIWPLYILLALSLFVGWYIEPGQLVEIQSLGLRYLAAISVIFLPIFFANLIFSSTFAEAEESDVSFGWNLMGAMLGGTLEYASLALGYRNLAVVVAVCYALAFVSYWIWSRRRTV